MMRSILITCCFVLCAAICAQSAQASDCYNCGNPYAYSNTWCGQTVLNDKLAQPHDAMMNPCGPRFGIPLFQGFFMPRGGYVGGHGGNRYGGYNGGGYPYYIYRGPRDFLNPNPPSIGY